MRLDQKEKRLAALLLGIVGAFCGIGCLVTGMGFWKVSMFPVALCCMAAAIVTAAAAKRKWFVAVPAALALVCLRLWRKGTLELSMEAFLGRISFLYDMGYGCGIIRWTNEVLLPDMSQLVLCLLGAWLAMGICWSYIRCKGTGIPLALVCLPVIPCMILVDTIPGGFYLFGTLLCGILLLLARLPKKAGNGEAVLKMLAIPVAAAVLLVMLFLPQKSYTRLEKVDDLFSWVQGLISGSGKDGPQTPVREEGSWVNLGAVGPKTHRRGTVMEVLTSQGGYLYLKGMAYDTYYGTWWDCKSTSPYVVSPPGGAQRSVKITTKAMHDVLYLPYGAYGIGTGDTVAVSEKKGQVENAGPWRGYNVKYRQQPAYSESWQLPSQNAPAAYTQLTDSARKAAEQYLARELPTLPSGVWSRAQEIVRHVSESAVYSLNTPKMPVGTKDFAMWFLEESDSGYCIHFATAATVLLRAAGIPCRYVTGYLVYAQANRTVEVENRNAHAWVEVFIDGVGWVPLEPTPSAGITETAAPETTAPPQTEIDTEPVTGPTEDTLTAPTQTETRPEQTEPPASAEATGAPQIKPTEQTGESHISDIGGGDELEEPKKPELRWIKWVAYGIGAAGAVIGQWRLRVALRIRKRNRGRKNARALARWQEVELHCRVRKEAPEQKLLQLAQKAKFSQHGITPEELREFDNWLNGSKNIISRQNLWRRLLATIIYALY